MRLGTLADHQYADGRVRDGTPQHYTASCEHHGRCAYCLKDRTYNSRRRQEAAEAQEKEAKA